ncbi:hypothetical protein SynRS9909_01181 [Synechococcus sp. RS9909]|nr:hypothetical protein SynRS9909_01181 [Synechococcus sp. RS9909]
MGPIPAEARRQEGLRLERPEQAFPTEPTIPLLVNDPRTVDSIAISVG